ncbi:Phosphatase ptc7 family protein, partial [Globisporangium splendens]
MTTLRTARSVALEAQEAKHLAANMKSLSDGDHVHLLMGGTMLLVAGVVFTAVRRARNRKAAEKALEDETYWLMAVEKVDTHAALPRTYTPPRAPQRTRSIPTRLYAPFCIEWCLPRAPSRATAFSTSEQSEQHDRAVVQHFGVGVGASAALRNAYDGRGPAGGVEAVPQQADALHPAGPDAQRRGQVSSEERELGDARGRERQPPGRRHAHEPHRAREARKDEGQRPGRLEHKVPSRNGALGSRRTASAGRRQAAGHRVAHGYRVAFAPHGCAARSIAYESFAMSIPHPAKRDTGGEDAYFVGTLTADDDTLVHHHDDKKKATTVGPVDVLTMGVSDGVGSWFEKGVSAKLYAEELMKAAHKAVKISYAKDHRIDPSEVLHAAWATVLQKEIVGSATACVIALDPQACELHAVNLGDSGFLIIRDKKSDRETARQRGTLDGSLMRKIRDRERDLTPAGRRKGAHVSYRSPQQLHYFNCPFQLGFVGPDLRSDVTKDLTTTSSLPTPMNEKPLFETPDNGVRLRVPVLEGDLIILATDGLFDNVDEEVLLEIVSSEPELEAMTKQLVQKAYDLSLDRMRDSPFARLAKENDLLWGGGMPDDITIIAARVRKHRAEDHAATAAVA